VRALDRKLARDLWRLRGQVLAIGMVIGSGVAVLIMSLGALEALQETASAYYERQRFAHVFAPLKRAPEELARRIAAIPGVQAVETRISRLALLDVEGFPEPVIGRLVSIPERGEPTLNRLTLRAGRSVAPGNPNEVVLGEAFAEGHGLRPGDRLRAILGGHRRTLEVVGIALSPEFVYAIGPGALMPDERRFGVLWMGREALAAAYDLDGAFNDVSLSLLRGARAREVIDQLDALLGSHGGTGAYDRSDQLSNWFLMSEIDQLGNLARILPVIFLAVAAFLTNMVLERLIAIERSEIGLLKAFGYSNLAVGWHYGRLVIAIAAFGILLGFGLGGWFGRVVTGIYAEFYRFPFVLFRPGPAVFGVAALVSLASALLGTARAVRRAVRMPPAEAMRPPAPALYTRAGATAALERRFDQPTRMIFRQIARWPGRSAVTSFGIAMAVGLLVTSLQWVDAIDRLVEVHFFEAQHQDLTVSLAEAQSSEAVRELERLPGVLRAEPARFVSVRLRAGPRSRREAIQGVPADARLQPVYDVAGHHVPLPPSGLLVSSKLAELLDVEPGDRLTVEVLEGRRPVEEIPVHGVFETYIGTPAFMDLDALNRLMRERPSLSAAHLQIDREREPGLFAALKGMPEVTAVMLRRAAVSKFHETMGETMLIFVGFFAAFSCMLAFGVAYNAARVALSERDRDLATLRVLGLSRMEISYILLGEMALLGWVGLPVGCAVGVGLAWLIADRFETELYRVPLVIEPSTFGLAVLITVAATGLSAALVRRRLDRLDLIAVLKTRE
jgi:putative ABC transport system permease protein